jgi:uncharacterized membrane protein (UPF0136 family)
MAFTFALPPLGLVAAAVGFTKVYYVVFAVLTIVGGIMGYVKAKSIVSIISGSISGIILIVCSILLRERPIVAGVLALIVSVLLAGKFVPDYVHKRAFVPGGLMALLSLVSIVATILVLIK